jgi:hypothetical protein
MQLFLSLVRVPPLTSLRTKQYIEALTREGDGFDYNRWLQRVREEEAEAKRVEATGTSGELAAAEIDRPISTPDNQHVWAFPASRLMPKTMRVSRTLRPHRQAESKTPKARLRRWLEKVHRAWGDFQASRRRDAVYIFLGRVFEIVMHYKVRRRTTRLLRYAFKFANLPFAKNADPYTAVIRCTSKRDIDNKTISKYARALRYVARRKEPDMQLKTFMKAAGGVNACADRYARYYGRRSRL